MSHNPDAKGSERISPAMNTKYTKYLTEAEKKRWTEGSMSFEGLKRAVAHSLFLKATDANLESYNANKKNFSDASNRSYQQLDIELLRKLVQPINGPSAN